MRVVHLEDTPVKPVRAVRGGDIKFQSMLEGTERTPGNFQLLVADTDVSFKSPRHRHNFEQVRISIHGHTNIGPRRNVAEGDVVYFPEGTYYGPQDQESVGAVSAAMVIQFGGPSGQGYMSQRQLHTGFDALLEQGRFEDGVYIRHAPAEDGRRKQDAYEAIWEQQNGRALQYPRPRFAEPVHFHEAHYPWRPVPQQAGAAIRHLGTFELETTLYGLQLQAGASYEGPARPQEQLVFVRQGSGRLAEGDSWRQYTAMHLLAGEALRMRADTLTDALVLALPRFEEAAA